MNLNVIKKVDDETCPYCGSNFIIFDKRETKMIKPTKYKVFDVEFRYKHYCMNCLNEYDISMFGNYTNSYDDEILLTTKCITTIEEKREKLNISIDNVIKNIEKSDYTNKVFATIFDNDDETETVNDIIKEKIK